LVASAFSSIAIKKATPFLHRNVWQSSQMVGYSGRSNLLKSRLNTSHLEIYIMPGLITPGIAPPNCLMRRSTVSKVLPNSESDREPLHPRRRNVDLEFSETIAAPLVPRCGDETRNTAIWGVLPDDAESAIALFAVIQAAKP
jgi:hypothetical protein